MIINLVYDSSVNGAPAGFKAAMSYAAQYLDSIMFDPITVNIEVGWGEIGGSAIQSGVDAVGNQYTFPVVSYSQLVGYLKANASSAEDALAIANLPKTDPSKGKGFYISSAEQKAWGLISANGSALDGEVGFNGLFPLNFDPNNQAIPGELNFIAIAEHELTHALGRVSGLEPGWSYLTTMDLFQYAAPGVIQTTTANPAYFSVNGGATNLNNFDTQYDAGDWASTVSNDAFGYEAYGAIDPVTSTDIALLDVLGFNTTAPAPATPTITSPTNGSTVSQAKPTILGTGISGDTVTVSIDGLVAGTALVINNAWSLTPANPLSNARHTVAATQAGASGPSSTAATDSFTVAVAAATQSFTVADQTTGTTVNSPGAVYSGPVAGLQKQYIYTGSDNMNVTVNTPDVFVHTGSGFDAIDISQGGGTNVLDGGTNSNFLFGSTGAASDDTFFVDDRGPTADIWSTVVNFHVGDAATIFGITSSNASAQWVDNQGATGYQGLTLHEWIAGKPTASLTLAGYTTNDLSNGRLSTTFGTEADGTPYLYVRGLQ